MNRQALCKKSIGILFFVFGILPAYSRIIRINITSIEPAFGGRAFGNIGVYEKLRGRAYGEVDPALPQNAVITDIAFAPRNAKGMVEYSMDIYLLKPASLANGNHKLFMDVNNRGAKVFGGFNNSSGGNDPTTAAQAGRGFLLNDGYTLAWNGWDISAAPVNNNLTISVPVAMQPDGSPITGPSYEYIVFDQPGALTYSMAYPAASLQKSQAALTVRNLLNDAPVAVAANEWEYVNDKSIRLLPAGTPFKQSAIYEFTYTAKNPVVAGLGLAATRDFMSFLRYAQADDLGNRNPLAGDVQFTFTYALSQPARYLNDFVALGFNADEQGRQVVDGMENWLGGGSGIGINYRFAQPGRTERNRQNHLYPEGIFPFAYSVLHDSLSGKTSGRMAQCMAGNTCPKIFAINSSNEYWCKAASLLHSDLQGNDLPEPANVRFFLVSGAQHGTGNGNSMGLCRQYQNPTNAEPLLRALFIALDQWVTKNIPPPESNVPRRSNGTAVFALPQPGSPTGIVPQSKLGWPGIPGVLYTGVITTRYYLNFGPSFNQGIITYYPPAVSSRQVYTNFVSRVDQDGNEVAGIRLPPVAAPTATTTGWALRREGFGENDGCEAAGQNIPFKNTKAERLAAHDPRLSLAERYTNHEGYVRAVTKAAQLLAGQRLLLAGDVTQYISDAQASSVLR